MPGCAGRGGTDRQSPVRNSRVGEQATFGLRTGGIRLWASHRLARTHREKETAQPLINGSGRRVISRRALVPPGR